MEDIIEQMKQLVNEFDFANFIPAVDSILGWIEMLVRIFVMAAPICILLFGLFYLLLPPKEANHRAGYRTYFGMGSVEAWQFSQRIGGLVYIILGGVMTLGALVAFILLLKGSIPTVLTGCAACVVVELILVALTVLTLNIIISVRYDRDGYRRGTR